jgi:rare lipoprotein A (peptidoglycan hydrolase)
MKFKILIIFLLLISCSSNYTKLDNRKPYNAKGFAYIYNEKDFENKIIKNKFNNELLQISHKDLKTGSLIKLINPKTKDSLVLKNIKKTKYPDFYKILITNAVAEKLNIDIELPLLEILEIKKNKSFIAKRAKIYQEEKKISVKAPVTSVKIKNISKKESNHKKITSNNIYILVASFYSDEAASLLKNRIIEEAPNYNNKQLKIRKKSIKEFEVLSGPYKSINLLKNDYIELKNFGFEELDIFINE